MLRARAAEARQNGVRFQDRALGNTDLVGKLGSLAAPLANWLDELTVHRAFVQAVAGIHRSRNLPEFHRQTFTAWFKPRETAPRLRAAGPAPARVPAPVGGVAEAR